MDKRLSYKESGVDIQKADDLVQFIKRKAQMHSRSVNAIGGFASLFSLEGLHYKEPVIASSTDGVGTKLLIASEMNCHKYIGIDLVAMCVNDLICHGARPLFFLDYYATGKLSMEISKCLIESIIEGCNQAEITLVGGETAEMPGLYSADEYDLAGFAVGIVEKSNILPNNIKPGDVILGLPSSGFHSNGFSLIRSVFRKLDVGYESLYEGKTWAEILLKPTTIYVKQVMSVIDLISGAAHITGGGLVENLKRIIPESVNVNLYEITIDGIFEWLMLNGELTKDEMIRTFNCGIGMVLVVPEKNVSAITAKIEGEVKILGVVTDK